MKIWIDADACPQMIKDVVFKASERLEIPTILVANRYVNAPKSKWISSVVVSMGADVADAYIVDELETEDLVITADIPLADHVVTKGALAINPRGELYTVDNIKERLSMRDFMTSLRDSGQMTGGPPPLNAKDKKLFAGSFDRIITKMLRDYRK